LKGSVFRNTDVLSKAIIAFVKEQMGGKNHSSGRRGR
jgi:hypothetical protein